MTPAERIASDIWRRLGQADLFGARLGEETLTDLLVLDMLPHRSVNAFTIHHPTRPQESLIGADLLMCIRYPGGSGRRLALQAKKLYPTGRYYARDHKDTSRTRQIDKLDRSGHVSVIDGTHSRTLFRLTGEAAASALEKLCSLDWSDHMTPDGAAVSASVARVTCDIVRNDLEGAPSYLISCDRSYGQYLFDVILDAGQEFGVAPLADPVV